jgi:hypothetical protein
VFTSHLEYWNSGNHGMLKACACWREFVLSCNRYTSISVLLNSSYTIFATSSKQTRCERVNEAQSIALTVMALLLSWLASWGFGISFWRRGALFYDPTGWVLGLLYPARRLSHKQSLALTVQSSSRWFMFVQARVSPSHASRHLQRLKEFVLK